MATLATTAASGAALDAGAKSLYVLTRSAKLFVNNDFEIIASVFAITYPLLQVIWVCILCRKKQELLSKTGQWIHKNSAQDPMLWRMENDLRGLPSQPDETLDKRPKLERAHSAAEKENLPLQRSGSALRRQYSQQDQRCYGELEGLARTHPHLVHPRQKAAYGVVESGVPPPSSQLLPHTPLVHPVLPPRSSSSDDEVPECVSDENDEYRDRGKYARWPNTRRPIPSLVTLQDPFHPS